MSRLAFGSVLLTGLVACGGGGTDPPPGAAVLKAYDEPTEDTYNEVPIDTSCLGTPSADMPAVAPIVFSTTIDDFQTGDIVPMANVTAFSGSDYTGNLAMATSDANGDVTITIPSGHRRIGFKMATTDGDYFDTFLLNQYFNPTGGPQTSPSTMSMVSVGTATALPALVGISRTPGTGVLAGTLRDCQNHEIANFIGVVSSTSGTQSPIEGARTFYFDPATDLPARNTVWQVSSQNGLFAVLELPPTATAYVQMWGYLTQEDLDNNEQTLLSELQVPVLADNIVTGSYELRRQ